MEENILIRKYRKSDKEAVLGLFRLNTPEYFSAEEENDLVDYLENELEQYFVIEIRKKIVGSGGINFGPNKTRGIISWDILHPDYQGQSLGSRLLNYRVEKLQKIKQVQKITVRTSQFAYGFYEKSGFKVMRVVENYWADGFHLFEMEYAVYSY